MDPFNPGAPTAQSHLAMIQSIIDRLAENSRTCKLGCVTLVAAVLFLVSRTGVPQHLLFVLFPVVLLGVLDAYYVSLERAYRASHKTALRLYVDQPGEPPLPTLEPEGHGPRLVLQTLRSFSVWWFYGGLLPVAPLGWLLLEWA